MELRFECRLNVPRDVLFTFHENPANLGLLMSDAREFRVLRHDGHIRPGAETWVEVTIGPMPIVLGFRHFLYEPPQRFGEELIHGPFRTFRHIHEFEDAGSDTVLRDHVEVVLAGYLGGESATPRVAAPVLRRAFAQRQRAFKRLEAEGVFGARSADASKES